MGPSLQALEGRQALEAALDALLARPARTLCLFLPATGPGWDTLARAGLLERFLEQGSAHQLRLVVRDAGGMTRDNARLTQLLRRYSQQVAIHCAGEQACRAEDAFAVNDAGDVWRRLPGRLPRGALEQGDAHRARALHQRFEEIWAESAPAVTATTLGL